MKNKILALSLMVGTMLMASPAHADFSQFMSATCGASCADPIGEQARTREHWKALLDMGTTEFVGQSIDGRTIDASSLLAAARTVGAVELDRWLRTGQSSSPMALDAVQQAMSSVSGIDMSRIVGQTFSMSNAPAAAEQSVSTMLASATGSEMFGPGGGGGAYCSQAVESAQNAVAQAYVSEVVEAAESESLGFSQAGGVAPSGDKRSESGLFGGSCLDIFMQGDFDTLFRPPQLSQLADKMGQMFQGGAAGGAGGAGGGAGGTCASMPTVHQQVAASNPNSAYMGGGGGFFPDMAFNSMEGEGKPVIGEGLGLINLASAPSNDNNASLASLF